MGEVRIGISGWRYAPWRGVFYPKGLPQKQELHYASRALPSIEINGSFYALQMPERYAGWYADTPDDFVFSVKAPRYVTHILRLREVEGPIANFLASGVLALRDKLGPLLWQFPPSMRFDAALFEAFFKLLPHDFAAGRSLARRHEERMAGRVGFGGDYAGPLRHAVEIRHPSFVTREFADLLRQYRVALVVADTAGKWPYCEELTADFVYLRLHGDKELYASGYNEAALRRWAARIDAWRRGGQPDDAQRIVERAPPRRKSRDVFCYFDNDIKVKAPFDAARLIELLAP
ncbi:hypothetical protein GCM10007860_04930 [Chitiniphilus shinanonensis]|uniref:DUF72 domain-containing protein n=1 Tax=Chitiniphilus shinanonensis TaxID=553088 RepID=A0ABQ6BQ83_9NEIS|nr:DUF72 domain-containing protein [Chitiniphilus shinanonensis]GLS03350.1 hypothetical protein GCM10007860_04930 [Chitiniphilus shinanonensis]